MSEKKQMIARKEWDEFQRSGLLWWTNRYLQALGWSIVFSTDDTTCEFIEAYPAHNEYRGFDGLSEGLGFARFTLTMFRDMRRMRETAVGLCEEIISKDHEHDLGDERDDCSHCWDRLAAKGLLEDLNSTFIIGGV